MFFILCNSIKKVKVRTPNTGSRLTSSVKDRFSTHESFDGENILNATKFKYSHLLEVYFSYIGGCAEGVWGRCRQADEWVAFRGPFVLLQSRSPMI